MKVLCNRIRCAIAGVTALALMAACQTESQSEISPQLTLQQATEYTADFEAPSFVPPERTITGLLEKLGGLRAAPTVCDRIRAEKRRSTIEQAGMAGIIVEGHAMSHSEGNAGTVTDEIALGNFKLALDILGDAISFAETDDRYVHPVLMSQKVQIYAILGDADAARSMRSYAATAWDEADYLGHARGRQGLYLSLMDASIAQAEGRLEAAERYYRKVADNPFTFFGGTNPTSLFSNLAANLMQQGRLAEAEVMARRAMQVGRYYFNGYTAKPVSIMSEILFEQGRIDDSETLARYAVNMHEYACAFPESVSLAIARQALARAQAAKGDWRGVLDQYGFIEQGLAGDPGSLEALFIGSIDWVLALAHMGQAEAALKNINRALRRDRDRPSGTEWAKVMLTATRGLVRFKAGDRTGAIADFRKALPVLLKGGVGEAGTLRRAEKDSRLRQILEGYLRILLEIHDSGRGGTFNIDPVSTMFSVVSVLQGQRVQRALAANAARATVASEDRDLAELVRRQQDAAQQISAALGILTELSAAPQGQVKPSRLRSLQERIAKLRSARRTISSEIQKRFPNYAGLTAPRPVSLVDLRKLLQPHEALLSTYVTEEYTYVWAVPKKGNISFSAVKLSHDELAEIVGLLRSALEPNARYLGDIPAFDVAKAHGLYERLLKPVQAGWKPASVIVYVAHGPLAQLPLSLLPTAPEIPASKSDLLFADYRKVPWLARSHSVTMLPSVASLKALWGPRSTSVNRRPFVGFGDPYFSTRQASAADANGKMPFDKPGARAAVTRSAQSTAVVLRSAPKTRAVASADLALLPRLPETREELVAMARSTGADPARSVFLGRRANEQQVKSMPLSDYRIVAFATHGLVSGDLNGLDQPALALTAPKVAKVKGDGLLTMSEILGLKLDADWVVLSACNTASADGQGAEAVSGLGRAFFYAGSRALLVSNWPVHSAATTELMKTLFQAQAGNPSMGRSEALRMARLHLIDAGVQKDKQGRAVFSYAHPIFWAPFTIVGDGGGAAPPFERSSVEATITAYR